MIDIDIDRFPLLPNKLEPDESEYERGYHDATSNLNALPTVDAVPVVRCKNCKHYHAEVGWCDEHSYFRDSDGNPCGPEESPDWKMFGDDDFCSYGEPKEDTNE